MYITVDRCSHVSGLPGVSLVSWLSGKVSRHECLAAQSSPTIYSFSLLSPSSSPGPRVLLIVLLGSVILLLRVVFLIRFISYRDSMGMLSSPSEDDRLQLPAHEQSCVPPRVRWLVYFYNTYTTLWVGVHFPETLAQLDRIVTYCIAILDENPNRVM